MESARGELGGELLPLSLGRFGNLAMARYVFAFDDHAGYPVPERLVRHPERREQVRHLGDLTIREADKLDLDPCTSELFVKRIKIGERRVDARIALVRLRREP